MKKTNNSLKKLRKAMEKVQDGDRYEHTLGVEYTAAALAMRYGGNVCDAQAAGLLHDCAKCLSDKKRLKICEKHHIPISKVERKNPFLLHAKAGAYLARKKYGVKNQDILSAIQNHTTGRKEMSLLEKIVFVADYIEPSRKHAPNLAEIRKMAFLDLDGALLKILEDTLSYLEISGGDIDPMTEETRKYYSKKKQ
ncbi:bis(5'-nucleosyl)-tetraphosphatase (symmetrical) YqeK [Acetatifactor muris]|uniref:bis(5'-nucleosyl)-tetraphosphatase (symmetrical) YqeK n=1 Tax=Acetatifactor muris TaxID=879566 RepID=UPI0023F0A7A2|nr:bis(5'-nucleosyl)-tetraphosphatase (symmetrical) YqeK [Acetatifactor muris]